MARPIPYGGPSQPYDHRSNIPELLLRQGNIAADRAERQGAILGNAVAGIGQNIAGAIQQHAERKEQSKRSLAFERAIESGDPNQILRVLGPKDGPPVVNALRASQPDVMKQYGDRMELARDIARGALSVPPENRSQAIEFGKNTLLQNGIFKPDELPEVIDEPFLRQLAAYGQEAAKPAGLTEVSPGASLYDPATKETVFTAPKPPTPPESRVVGRSLVGPDGKVIYRDPDAPKAEKDERLVQVMQDGVPVWVRESEAVGKPAAQAARAVTGQERQGLSFYNRAKQASDDIAPLEDAISKAGIGSQLQLQAGWNILQTEEQQKYRQAQRAFTEARLRRESGAAIAAHEFENDSKTYFAQPGDKPAAMEQKRKAREVVLNGLRFGSGKAYDEYYGEPAPTPKNTAAPTTARPIPPGEITVTAPNGKVYKFKSKAEADVFRKRAGIP